MKKIKKGVANFFLKIKRSFMHLFDKKPNVIEQGFIVSVPSVPSVRSFEPETLSVKEKTKNSARESKEIKKKKKIVQRLENEVSMYMLMEQREDESFEDTFVDEDRSVLTSSTGRGSRLGDELRMFRMSRKKEFGNRLDVVESLPTLDDQVSEITFRDSSSSFPIICTSDYEPKIETRHASSSWFAISLLDSLNITSVVSDVSTN